MFENLKTLAKRAINLDEIKFLIKIYKIPKVKKWIIQANISQMQEGIDPNEHILGLYSAATEEINPLKVEGTPYTLLDTGVFRKSLSVLVHGNGDFSVITNDTRVLLQGVFGTIGEKYEHSLGLSPYHIGKLSDLVLPILIKETRKALHI